uniref:PNT domain-containing protein n=1 Tax=Timema cristinae TaxID=61476 RepID=A0A7R9CDE7_TIMCR|nr:unnamed protein product [Timema cristinae]
MPPLQFNPSTASRHCRKFSSLPSSPVYIGRLHPRLWSETHVAHWLYWAIREFSLEGVPLNQFHMRGKDICAMGKEAFLARAPPFMGDILWEHLEILQKGTYRYVGGEDMYVGALRLATLASGAENDVTSPPTPSRDNTWGHRGW